MTLSSNSIRGSYRNQTIVNNNTNDIDICHTKTCLCCFDMKGCSIFIKSSVTNRCYRINNKDTKLNCNSKNIIYLITCTNCNVQYVGETRTTFKKRMNGYRSHIQLKHTNTHVHTHFTKTCKPHHFKAQPIEYINDDLKGSTTLRKYREDYWMKELRTIYPYGLNERCREGDSKRIKNIFNLYPKLKTKHIATKQTRKFRTFDPCKIYDYIMKLCNNRKSWIYMIHKFIISFNRKQSKILYNYIRTHKTNISNRIQKMIEDMLYYKFADIEDKIKSMSKGNCPKLRMKIPFLSKGVELLNLEQIINSNRLDETLPSFVKIRKPGLLYTYLPPIRNKVFNYDDALNNISDYNNITCSCSNSRFCNKDTGHIITGDLDFIKDPKLRELFGYGTSYRIPKSNNWNKIYESLSIAVDDCITTWCKKEHVDIQVLLDWKHTLLQQVKHRINTLRITYRSKSMYDNDNMIDLLNDKEVNNALKLLHENYVIVNADKASNNIIIMCKKYYVECMVKELGLYNDEIDDKNMTYKKIDDTMNDIINKHNTYMTKYGIVIPEKMMQLPKMYSIPKMHKKVPKQRFIAASNKCSTKPLSNIITKCLKLILAQQRKYCRQIFLRTGVNMMWIAENSDDILESINDVNDDKNAKNVYTYDFSTLYTNIPHDDLKERMRWLIGKSFYNDSKQFMYISNRDATWYKRRGTLKVSKDDLLTHIDYLIDNVYITVGEHIFRQTVGIPMGTDCAPFLANLYLYALEFNYLNDLMKHDIHTARKLSKSHRYIDDLLIFNSDGIMNEHKTKIYPKELILNNENEHEKHCTFLDINITVNRNKTITTNVYDKRDDFNFTINNFPNVSGNIHAARSHGIIISQLIRYSKICMNLDDFIERTNTMTTKLQSQYFNTKMLKKKMSNFYDKYYHLVKKYNCSKLKLFSLVF